MAKIYKFRELRKILKRYDPRFDIYTQKRGSHRTIVHPDIGGKEISFPLPVSNDGDDIRPGYISDLRELFKIPRAILP